MRRAFVPGGTEQEAQAQCPWAAVVVPVEGGWMAFESVEDHRIWTQQQ